MRALVDHGALGSEDARDPWDNRYITFGSRHEVVSLGLDGEEGSEDDWAVSLQGDLLLRLIDYHSEEEENEYEREHR